MASETREPDIRQDGKAAATSQHAGCSALRCQSPAKAGLWLLVVVVVVEKDIYSKPASFHFFMTMKELHLFSCLKEFLT